MKNKKEIQMVKRILKTRFNYLTEKDVAMLNYNPDKLIDLISQTSGYSTEEVFVILNQLTQHFQYEPNYV